MAIGRALFALAIVAPFSACEEPAPEALPPVVQTFVDEHPELKLDIRQAEPAPDWAQRKRWRLLLKDGQLLILYEKAGAIETVRRSDLSTFWEQRTP